jgi:two-component system, cell cycle sensor histidine kinase and response regulator CckA
VSFFSKWQQAYDHYLDMLPPPALSRGHVLIVDDDAGVRNVCTTLLHALGYQTDATSSGVQALESLSNNDHQPVQLVLLDLELPGMHGAEVLRAVKASQPHVRVLVMSGKPGRDLHSLLADGADGVLRKPFGMSDLDDSVGAALS